MYDAINNILSTIYNVLHFLQIYFIPFTYKLRYQFTKYFSTPLLYDHHKAFFLVMAVAYTRSIAFLVADLTLICDVLCLVVTFPSQTCTFKCVATIGDSNKVDTDRNMFVLYVHVRPKTIRSLPVEFRSTRERLFSKLLAAISVSYSDLNDYLFQPDNLFQSSQ